MVGIALLIFALLIAFAFINSKIYNPIFGILSFLGIGVFLMFIEFVGYKADANMLKFSKAIYYVKTCVVMPYADALEYFGFKKLADSGEWLFYVFPIGIFIIAFIISSFIRKITRDR